MLKKYMGIGLLILGILVLVISLSADYIGLGKAAHPVIGWKQLLGAVLGLAFAIAGFILTRIKKLR
jgi:uncharacterized membrane protein